MSRLDDLQELREGLMERMADCASDQNYAVLGRLLADVLKQIDELGGSDQGEKAVTPLDEFSRRLAARGAATPAAHRSASG